MSPQSSSRDGDGSAHRLLVSTRHRMAWIAPHIALWSVAVGVLKMAALGSGCTDLCMVANAWLWYTVFYAALSISALVGAIEVLLWMHALPRGNATHLKPSNH